MNPNLDTRIRIERKIIGQDATYGTQTVTWSLLAVVWAEKRDVQPSRSEQVRQGVVQARDQTRFRFRYRDDIDSTMRILLEGETYEIVGGPAELGRREYTEVVCERLRPQ